MLNKATYTVQKTNGYGWFDLEVFTYKKEALHRYNEEQLDDGESIRVLETGKAYAITPIGTFYNNDYSKVLAERRK